MTSGSTASAEAVADGSCGADLYWIPVGAGARVVRVCSTAFEAISAAAHRRPRGELYHAALVVRVPEGRYAIEQAPVPDRRGTERGVVAEGPVVSRVAGRFRWFRYEVRCWRDGVIPDIGEAVASPVRVTGDAAVARRIIDVLPEVPQLRWGRDDVGAGEMWNSNSVVSWTLASSGIALDSLDPPAGGRAPGWGAGALVAGGRTTREVPAAV